MPATVFGIIAFFCLKFALDIAEHDLSGALSPLAVIGVGIQGLLIVGLLLAREMARGFFVAFAILGLLADFIGVGVFLASGSSHLRAISVISVLVSMASRGYIIYACETKRVRDWIHFHERARRARVTSR